MGETSPKRVNIWQMVLFGLPAMVSAITHGPVAGILPSLYAEKFNLNLAVIGVVLLIARVFDAVIDPAVGFLSDRTKGRFGMRKPWIVAGTVIMTAAIFFLLRPVGSASTAYLLTLLLVLYFGWTLIEIPYSAWGLEVSRDSRDRAKIAAFRAGALFAGGLLFTLAPALVPAAQGRMNFEALGVLALVLVVLSPLSTWAAVAFVPQGEAVKTEKPRLSELWPSVRANRPFQIFFVAFLFIGLASGVSSVVSFMYIDTYLDIGAKYTQLFVPAIILGPLMLPIWIFVINRIDKYKVMAVAFTIYIFVMPLPWFVSPGPDAFIPMLIYYLVLTMFTPLLMIVTPTILGDIVDLDQLNTGKNRTGQYAAFLTLIQKATVAVGGPLALLAIGLFGYQPGALANDETAILGLRLVFNLLPVALVIPGVYCLWIFPMTDKRHKEIRAELAARAEAELPAQEIKT